MSGPQRSAGAACAYERAAKGNGIAPPMDLVALSLRCSHSPSRLAPLPVAWHLGPECRGWRPRRTLAAAVTAARDVDGARLPRLEAALSARSREDA